MTEKPAPKRRGRPKKKVETKVGTPELTPEEQDTEQPEIKAAEKKIEAKVEKDNPISGLSNDKLMELLSEAMSKISTLENINKFSDKPVVPIRHSGHGPQLIIQVQGDDDVVLQSKAPRDAAVIPLNDFRFIQKNTDWLDKGYMYVDGENTDNNPNLVIDAERWLEDKDEDSINEEVQKITSDATLNYLYDHTEDRKKTGALLALREAVANRLEELFNIVMVEDPSDSSGETVLRVGKKR